jgi:hypothetical protein
MYNKKIKYKQIINNRAYKDAAPPAPGGAAKGHAKHLR